MSGNEQLLARIWRRCRVLSSRNSIISAFRYARNTQRPSHDHRDDEHAQGKSQHVEPGHDQRGHKSAPHLACRRHAWVSASRKRTERIVHNIQNKIAARRKSPRLRGRPQRNARQETPRAERAARIQEQSPCRHQEVICYRRIVSRQCRLPSRGIGVADRRGGSSASRC